MRLYWHSPSKALCDMHRDMLSGRATVLGFPLFYQRAGIGTYCLDSRGLRLIFRLRALTVQGVRRPPPRRARLCQSPLLLRPGAPASPTREGNGDRRDGGASPLPGVG
jgi:hypothetical protein